MIRSDNILKFLFNFSLKSGLFMKVIIQKKCEKVPSEMKSCSKKLYLKTQQINENATDVSAVTTKIEESVLTC